MEPDVKYRLLLNGELFEFASKTELLDFISWQVTGYPKIDFTVENVKKQQRQFRQVGQTGSLRMPNK